MVLCYHAVSPRWSAPLSVTPETLETQLSMLVGRGWQGATFTEAVLRPPHKRTLAVTFDDGFLSVLEQAHPILERLGIPATIFVPTGFMDRRQTLSWPGIEQWVQTPYAHELQGMSWDDLRSLSELGWEIGSHTRTHARLTQLDDEGASAELVESRNECSERIGRQCTSLAYPYGDADGRVAQAAESAGYVAAGGLSSSLVEHGPLRWPRVGIYNGDRGWRFRLKVNPAMRWIRATPLWPAHE